MIRLNMHEAKTHLSRHVRKLRYGDRILLCNRNVPVAEIVPLMSSKTAVKVTTKAVGKRRPIGLGRGTFRVPASFFEELPHEIEDLFDGLSS